MTLKEAHLLFRSLKQYAEFSQTVKLKERRLKELIQEHDIKSIDGYGLEVRDDGIYYLKLSQRNPRYLKLDL